MERRKSAAPKGGRNGNVSKWEDVTASQSSRCLCMPGISNQTESQLDCLPFSNKSRQDMKLSSESVRVSYQFNSLPDAPFGSPQNQFFPTMYDTDKKGSKKKLAEDIKLEELVFSGCRLYTKPRWKQHSTDLQGMSVLIPFQFLLFNHWASNHMN